MHTRTAARIHGAAAHPGAAPTSGPPAPRPAVRCRRRRAGFAGPAAAIGAAREGGPEQPLREWLTREGGYMHPALRLVDSAPCGCRGVVAAEAIPLSQLEDHGPLLVVPRALHLENGAALALLECWAGREAARAAAAQMGSAWLVAVAVAHERALGGASRWAPYLASLPGEPPSPWLLPRARLQAAAAAALAGAPPGGGGGAGAGGAPKGEAAGGQVGQWVVAAEAFRADIEEEARRVCALLSEAAEASEAAALRRSAAGGSGNGGGRGGGGGGGGGGSGPGGWLLPDALIWALAHVQSRSLGTAGSSGLVPAVDLLNHSPRGRPPMLQLDDADRLVVTVLPIEGGEAVGMGQGGELLISYGDGGDGPLAMWLKFGFVSPEWW